MKPLKRCQTKAGAYVPLIDIEDDDVEIVDYWESAHTKKGESSEKRENRRVSPQSVIRIDDDDENESYTNRTSAHQEEGFAEFESDADATSSHRSHCPYDIPREARSGCYRFGDDEYEYEPIEIDSDCEVMEDSTGMLREQWEKAASLKVSRQKANIDPERMETASGSNSSDVGEKNMTEPFSEVPSCSKANAPFTGAEVPPTFNVVNEESKASSDQDTLFPEFDWRNLGRSSFKIYMREGIKEGNRKLFDEFFSKNIPSTSFGVDGKGQKEQCCAANRETEGMSWKTGNLESHSPQKTSINPAQGSTDNERNSSHIFGEISTTEFVKCDCVFPKYCVCGSNRDSGVEKIHVEEQIPSFTSCEEKSEHSKAGFDNQGENTPNNIPVDMECEADCEESRSKETNEELEKLSSSETGVGHDNPFVESDTINAPQGSSSGNPVVEANVGINIINEKEKLKETDEYKRAMEEELVLRQQQLKLQAEEAQRLRKRKKAEKLRVANMEKRQKQRLEEVRASQMQVSANLDMKEQFRSEVIKELKVLEMRCVDMGSLLRSLGVQVEGGAHPSPQQIHGAYKRAVLKFHPDRTSGSSLKQQVEAEEKFKLISRMKEKYKLR